MVTGTRQQYARALQRARAQGGLLAVRELGNGRFAVTGSQGTQYTLFDDGHEIICTCPAGAAQQPCWHSAAVYQLRIAKAAVRTPEPPARPSDAQQRDALKQAIRRPLPVDDDAGPSLASLLDARPRSAAA